jgi:hypothetical protein
MRAPMSLASQAFLKSLTMLACRVFGAAGAWTAQTRRRAVEASWRHAAGVRPVISATSAKGVAEDVVQDQCDALGRGHRFERDEERHADRVIRGELVGRVSRGALRAAGPLGQRAAAQAAKRPRRSLAAPVQSRAC